MRILMVSAEMAPFVKVGGLADVTASLAAALAARGNQVRVVLPLYADVDRRAHEVHLLRRCHVFPIRVGQRLHNARLSIQGSGRGSVKVYFVGADGLFDAPGIYTDADDFPLAEGLARAVFHCQAALSVPALLDWVPDVVHCHDAESALAAVYLKRWCGSLPGLRDAGSLLTIHNLAHQEIHKPSEIETIGLPAAMSEYPSPLEYHGKLNLLKAGVEVADLVNTVSPTYAREVIDDPAFGCGLGGVLEGRGDDFSGILNGADIREWNPATDRHLPTNFSSGRPAGKAACRESLVAELGLSAEDGPLLGVVSRLVEQKGFDLLLPVLDDCIAAGASVIVLGTGGEYFHNAFAEAAVRHPRRIAFIDRFDEELAHRIIAGSDAFLVPSIFEPCGLTQMYALRYGSLPVVRATGGLADTVTDVDDGTGDGDGFVFEKAESEALLDAVGRLLTLWENQERWRRVMARGMARDFSWDRSAERYEELYERLQGREAADDA